jgi:hypothetical protein
MAALENNRGFHNVRPPGAVVASPVKKTRKRKKPVDQSTSKSLESAAKVAAL